MRFDKSGKKGKRLVKKIAPGGKSSERVEKKKKNENRPVCGISGAKLPGKRRNRKYPEFTPKASREIIKYEAREIKEEEE
jgi:ribosomal protein L34E